MGHGGARTGAGSKQGSKWPATLKKEEARELLRQRVLKDMEPMVQAQVANAIGLKYLVVRDKASGKFIRVTEAMAKAKLGQSEEIIEAWEKEPSTPAFTDLMNRALDKPKEQEQEHLVSGALVIKWKDE